jgi:hypothetical protein
MATILFGWELGNGLGHIAPLGPLAHELAERGHTVFVAVRDLRLAAAVFNRDRVTLLQAPTQMRKSSAHIPAAASYA